MLEDSTYNYWNGLHKEPGWIELVFRFTSSPSSSFFGTTVANDTATASLHGLSRLRWYISAATRLYPFTSPHNVPILPCDLTGPLPPGNQFGARCG